MADNAQTVFRLLSDIVNCTPQSDYVDNVEREACVAIAALLAERVALREALEQASERLDAFWDGTQRDESDLLLAKKIDAALMGECDRHGSARD